uniref:Beta-glucosidase n=2 Tax=Octactis speculum TaxID=3111310 RepID=A0A7S2G7H8_9STRA|mmetsp:Transcript_38849/g.52690  ORF Transcript_38849/g.52690 Transcript_38849/m.52690 type:complete len:231 (+) Transcript_38849:68-760(+)
MKLAWFADPVFKGDYPHTMKVILGDKLPSFNESEVKLLNGSADFFGLNHYGSGYASNSQYAGWMSAYNSVSEAGLLQDPDATWLYSAPWGFRKLLNWAADRYDSPEIIVTEGGWAATNYVDDSQRFDYYANYTSEMLKAINEDGLNITGYYAWSYIDNIEWEMGFTERFGIVYNDYGLGLDLNAPVNQSEQPTTNQTRTRKCSSYWFEKVWRSNSLVDPLSVSLDECIGA